MRSHPRNSISRSRLSLASFSQCGSLRCGKVAHGVLFGVKEEERFAVRSELFI